MKSGSADQWMHQGDCSICRKQRYCSKSCKANKRLIDRRMDQALMKTPVGQMMKQINDVLRGR